MPTAYALTCPHCRAPLPAVARGVLSVRCAYCDHDVSIKHTAFVHAPVVPPTVETPSPTVRAPRLMLALGLAGVAVAVAASTLARRASTTHNARRDEGVHVPAGEHLQWDAGHAPIAADVDGDGIEDMIGFYRLLGAETVTVHLGALSGRTWQRLWKTPKLAEGTAQALVFAIAGTAIVVVDGRGEVRAYDRSSGALQHTARLTDTAKRMCAIDSHRLWIDVADNAHVTFDPATGTIAPAPEPAGCARPTTDDCTGWDLRPRAARALASCVPYDRQPAVPGMQVDYALRSGSVAVALGGKDPGTRISMIAGFVPDQDPSADPRARQSGAAAPKPKPMWMRRLNPAPDAVTPIGAATVADIAGDRLITVYEVGHKNIRVQVADAATGTIRWDVALPRPDAGSLPRALNVSASRLYVPHWTWLDVFDLETGKVLATIGRW